MGGGDTEPPIVQHSQLGNLKLQVHPRQSDLYGRSRLAKAGIAWAKFQISRRHVSLKPPLDRLTSGESIRRTEPYR